MSKEMTVIVLGICVIIVPYLGVPGTWRTALLVVSGIGIATIGFLLRGEALGRGSGGTKHNTFTESLPTHGMPADTHSTHEHKDGITSLN